MIYDEQSHLIRSNGFIKNFQNGMKTTIQVLYH